MRQTRWQIRSIFLYLAGLLIFAASALVSVYVPNASAQFIDRITRPCASGGGSSLVQTQTLNVLINTCTGGQVLINGVPLVIVPGGGLGDPGSNGVVIRTALNTTVARTLTVSAPITIANGTGVAGNPLIACATCGITTNPLSQFAATTSAQLAGVISDETGSPGLLVFNNAPVFSTSIRLGTVSSATGQLNLANSASAFLTTIQAGNAAAARTYTWPTNFGAAGSVLTDAAGNGTLSWTSPAAGFVCGACTLDTVQAGDGAGNFQNTRITDDGAIIEAESRTINLGDFNYINDGTLFTLNDANKTIYISANDAGAGSTLDLNGNALSALLSSGAGGLLSLAGTGNVLLQSGASDFVQIAASTRVITLSALNGIVLAGELTTPSAIRTGTALNTDVAGTLTIGGGGTVTYTFTQTYVTAPVCTSDDTDTTPLITGSSATTTTLTVRGTAGHVVSYQCVGLN